MKRGLIVAAGEGVPPRLLQALADESDLVYAVDGGYRHCQAAGIAPDLLLGDMDSLGIPPEETGMPFERLPCEKDDTDALYAARRLLAQGVERITLACALGGRLDHMLGNLGVLCFLLEQGAAGRIVDSRCCAEAFAPGEHTLKKEGYNLFSLFPLEGACEGVCIQNAKYPLERYRLVMGFPIGVSNEFLLGDARVSFESGKLLAIRLKI